MGTHSLSFFSVFARDHGKKSELEKITETSEK